VDAAELELTDSHDEPVAEVDLIAHGDGHLLTAEAKRWARSAKPTTALASSPTVTNRGPTTGRSDHPRHSRPGVETGKRDALRNAISTRTCAWHAAPPPRLRSWQRCRAGPRSGHRKWPHTPMVVTTEDRVDFDHLPKIRTDVAYRTRTWRHGRGLVRKCPRTYEQPGAPQRSTGH
jgi:hypothetical protein